MSLRRCTSCHRLERCSADQVELLVAGGSRRPARHPDLAALDVLLAARAGEGGPVVAVCAACGQPMTSDDLAAAAIPWTLSTPAGDLRVSQQGVDGPDGPLSPAEARRWLRGVRKQPLQLKPFTALFKTGLFVFMLVPVLLWMVAVAIVATFIANGAGL